MNQIKDINSQEYMVDSTSIRDIPFFELIPTTNIASYMSYNICIELLYTRRCIETHQEYASLQHIALLSKVDVRASCVIFSKFLQGEEPCHALKINK